jgi:hypothetical protein
MGEFVDAIKLRDFEENLTDVCNCLESHLLELQLMKEFDDFICTRDGQI